MARVTLAGPELAGLTIDQPAASVRVLIPSGDGLIMPRWAGNEFLLPDGTRPTIRTFTPRRMDASNLELDLEVVIHGEGAASAWATTAEPGDPAAVSGPGRGYDVDVSARAFVLGGDETAIPAISQVLEAIPEGLAVQVHIEVATPDARRDLPGHPAVSWHDARPGDPPGSALVTAFRDAALAPGTRVWVAGEAASVQQIRRNLFEDRGWPRTHAWIRGYWKHGRAASE